MTSLSAHIRGVGLLGPGLNDWASAAPVLCDHSPYLSQPTVVPAPVALPPAERRRTGTVVRLALAVGLEAASRAGAKPAMLPTVFTSSGGDGQNCHEICQALASSDRQLSPTRFHNSVHNAAAGYWSIATGATPASNVLCAFDGSFAAGLLEALTQSAVHGTNVLLIAYDAAYPEPLRVKRPISDAFGVALVLAPEAPVASQSAAAPLARLSAALTELPSARLSDPSLEAVRSAIPAARSLPVLRLLARRSAGVAVIDYLDDLRLAIEVSPCD